MRSELNLPAVTPAVHIASRLQTLAAPLDRVGLPIRWQKAVDRAAKMDQNNPTMADIMDLVLLCVEDANDSAARGGEAEVRIHGKPVAHFSFPIIQLALIAKVGEVCDPRGLTEQDDVTGEWLKARLLAIFRRHHQGHVLTLTVDDYEAKLTATGMYPERARQLAGLIASILAGARVTGTIDGAKPLDQFATRGGDPVLLSSQGRRPHHR